MTKKIFAALAMSAIVASLLVGCKPSSDTPDTTTPPADPVAKTAPTTDKAVTPPPSSTPAPAPDKTK